MCIHKGLNFWIHNIDPNNPIAKVNHKANYGSKSNNLLIVAKKGQVFFFFFKYLWVCLYIDLFDFWGFNFSAFLD